MSPIMETLTGIMIAVLIFYSGKLMSNGELDINNFFIPCCNDACLSACKVFIYAEYGIESGFICSSKILPIIDQENEIKDEMILRL